MTPTSAVPDASKLKLVAIQPPQSRMAALRAALRTETRIAEALAQRSRGLMTLFESLNQRALRQAVDLADARRRIDALGHALRASLAAGEKLEEGSMRAVAETILAAFEMGAGPRIALEGPPACLTPHTRRLVSLILFDLASRSERYGALGAADGRIALDWIAEENGGLRVIWREFGVRPGAERQRRSVGGALRDLISDGFRNPMRQNASPFGSIAEFTIPPDALRARSGPPPRRVVVAVDDAALAATLGALLLVGGVPEVVSARNVAEAAEALAAGPADLVFADHAEAGAAPDGRRPAILVVAPSHEEARSVLTLPVDPTRLAEAMAAALRER